MKISNVLSSLVSVWSDWQNTGFLINRRFIRSGTIVTWENYQPEMIGEPIFPNHVVDLFNRGQYTFQVGVDGSLIQMYYVFNKKDELASANLSFYFVGDDPNIPVGWLRIDFDPSSYRGVLHPRCHLHLSSFPNSRFIVDGVPTPKQFIEFVVAMCYSDVYQRYHTNELGVFTDEKRMCSINTPCFHLEERNLYKYMAHLKIPVESAPPI